MMMNVMRSVIMMVFIIAVQGTASSTNWTDLKVGFENVTALEAFDPASTLLQYRFSVPEAFNGTGWFCFVSYFGHYKENGRDDYFGKIFVYYVVVDYKITNDSYVAVYSEGGGHKNPLDGYCMDNTVLLQNPLEVEEHVTWTWDLTSFNMATISTVDNTAAAVADFTSCDHYKEWVELVQSGNITHVQTLHGVGYNITANGEDVRAEDVRTKYVRAEYRFQEKEATWSLGKLVTWFLGYQ